MAEVCNLMRMGWAVMYVVDGLLLSGIDLSIESTYFVGNLFCQPFMLHRL